MLNLTTAPFLKIKKLKNPALQGTIESGQKPKDRQSLKNKLQRKEQFKKKDNFPTNTVTDEEPKIKLSIKNVHNFMNILMIPSLF